MKKLEPYPIASALFYIFTILYVVCIGVKLILISVGIEGFWHMHKIWVLILPGFNGLDSLSILIGLVEVSLGSYLVGYIIVPVYNFLTRKKVSEHKIEVKPVILRFKTLFVTLTVYASILLTLCLIYDLFVPSEYQMLSLWKLLIPGFTGLNLMSYIVGLGAIAIYSAYTSFIFSKTLNFFENSELKKNNNNTVQKIKVLEETKSTGVRKKYSSKYFGIAAGIFFAILFILIAINMFFSGEDYIVFIKPFIPFFNSVNALNIIGGITVSFLWGWFLGYFFLNVYHWFDKRFNSN